MYVKHGGSFTFDMMSPATPHPHTPILFFLTASGTVLFRPNAHHPSLPLPLCLPPTFVAPVAFAAPPLHVPSCFSSFKTPLSSLFLCVSAGVLHCTVYLTTPSPLSPTRFCPRPPPRVSSPSRPRSRLAECLPTPLPSSFCLLFLLYRRLLASFVFCLFTHFALSLAFFFSCS